MIKKSVFEDEIIAGMQKKLAMPEIEAAMDKIVDAVDYLGSAVDIFEEAGMTSQADRVLKILLKIAQKHDPKNDPHTKGLTSEKMVQNLLHHGTEFNMSDDNSADNLLNVDIGESPLTGVASEEDPMNEMDFEDEI